MENREIKFRSVFFDSKGKFSHFGYWGFINHKDEYDSRCFKSPGTTSSNIRKFENQYTGLKDKNDKEIYEGDILDKKVDFTYVKKEWISEKGKRIICPKRLRYCCVWDEIHAQYEFETKTPYPFNANIFIPHIIYYEVIGNIYENPELLTDKNK